MSPQSVRRAHTLAVLMAAVALTVSCTCSAFPTLWTTETGVLEVDIDYTGAWYRETFGYAREAEDIRHFVLIMPESKASRATAAEIFTNLHFPAEPGDPLITEERPDLLWASAYLHEAPKGYFTGEFEPGRYAIAVAFIAAPLSREEAGVSEDAILYAGITGGGASTDYRAVVIEPGEVTEMKFTLTDDNGWG